MVTDFITEPFIKKSCIVLFVTSLHSHFFLEIYDIFEDRIQTILCYFLPTLDMYKLCKSKAPIRT